MLHHELHTRQRRVIKTLWLCVSVFGGGCCRSVGGGCMSGRFQMVTDVRGVKNLCSAFVGALGLQMLTALLSEVLFSHFSEIWDSAVFTEN